MEHDRSDVSSPVPRAKGDVHLFFPPLKETDTTQESPPKEDRDTLHPKRYSGTFSRQDSSQAMFSEEDDDLHSEFSQHTLLATLGTNKAHINQGITHSSL